MAGKVKVAGKERASSLLATKGGKLKQSLSGSDIYCLVVLKIKPSPDGQ